MLSKERDEHGQAAPGGPAGTRQTQQRRAQEEGRAESFLIHRQHPGALARAPQPEAPEPQQDVEAKASAGRSHISRAEVPAGPDPVPGPRERERWAGPSGARGGRPCPRMPPGGPPALGPQRLAARDRQTAALRAERGGSSPRQASRPPWPVSRPHPAGRGCPGPEP